jgi:hypothetical protein
VAAGVLPEYTPASRSGPPPAVFQIPKFVCIGGIYSRRKEQFSEQAILHVKIDCEFVISIRK